MIKKENLNKEIRRKRPRKKERKSTKVFTYREKSKEAQKILNSDGKF